MPNFDSEHRLWQEPGWTSEKRLLLGIDAPLTAATRYALHTVGEFFAPCTAHVRLLLLTVIPVPYIGGRYVPPSRVSPTHEQRRQAMEALRTACAALQEHGLTRSHIETLIREGSAADELVRVASQQRIDCLIIGSQGHSLGQRLRRVVSGSTSHCVLRHASCPVLVVTLPRSRQPDDLIAWYETAIQRGLADHPSTLVNVTAADVAGRFRPPHVHTAGRKERTAAAQALEHLARSGILHRHAVSGEMHYLND